MFIAICINALFVSPCALCKFCFNFVCMCCFTMWILTSLKDTVRPHLPCSSLPRKRNPPKAEAGSSKRHVCRASSMIKRPRAFLDSVGQTSKTATTLSAWRALTDAFLSRHITHQSQLASFRRKRPSLPVESMRVCAAAMLHENRSPF